MSKDYERLSAIIEAFIYAATGRIMARGLTMILPVIKQL